MQTKSNYKLLERLIIRLLLSHIQNSPMKCRTAERSEHSELYQDDNYMIDLDTFLLHYGRESDPHTTRNQIFIEFHRNS